MVRFVLVWFLIFVDFTRERVIIHDSNTKIDDSIRVRCVNKVKYSRSVKIAMNPELLLHGQCNPLTHLIGF
jgi:hypothetical protein